MVLRGWVYVITNKAMVDLVKVGFSTKDPVLRAREFDATGVPHRYEVVFDALVSNPRDVEQPEFVNDDETPGDVNLMSVAATFC